MIQDIANINPEVEEIGSALRNGEAKITEKNTPYIFSLLSKIYSKPKESIVREITSNCFDAHVYSKKTDEVVFVRLYVDEAGERFIEFVDQGPGISYQGMDDIFMSYGESTKRESDDFIGCFGLGSKSPFSESNYFYVITKHNGVESTYLLTASLMEKPKYDCLVEIEVDPENTGTIVRVPIKKNHGELEAWQFAIQQQLRYFSNVFVVGFPQVVNEYKIHKFRNFQVREDYFLSNVRNQLHLCLGDVYYPIQFGEIGMDNIYFNAALTFKIGELDVSPNREELLYNDRTKKVITAKILEFKKELTTIVTDEKNFQCNSLMDFRNRSISLSDHRTIVVKNIIPDTEINLNLSDIKVTSTNLNYKVYLYNGYYALDPYKFNPENFCKVILTTNNRYNGPKLAKPNNSFNNSELKFNKTSDSKYVIIPESKHKLAFNERAFLNNQNVSRVVQMNLAKIVKQNMAYIFKKNVLSHEHQLGLRLAKVFENKYKAEVLSMNFKFIEEYAIPKDYGKIPRTTSVKKADQTILYYFKAPRGGGYDRRENMVDYLENLTNIQVYGLREDVEDLNRIHDVFNVPVFYLSKKYIADIKHIPSFFDIKEIMTKKGDSKFLKHADIDKFVTKNVECKIFATEAVKFKNIFNMDNFFNLKPMILSSKKPAENLGKFISIILRVKKKDIFDTQYRYNTHSIERAISKEFVDQKEIQIRKDLKDNLSVFETFYNFSKEFYFELKQMQVYDWNRELKIQEMIDLMEQNLTFKQVKLNKYVKTIK